METSSDSRDNWSGMAPVSELFLSVSALHSNQAHDDNLKGVQRTEAGGSRLSTTVAYVTWLGVLPVQDTPQYVSSSEPFKHCTKGRHSTIEVHVDQSCVHNEPQADTAHSQHAVRTSQSHGPGRLGLASLSRCATASHR